MGLLNIYECLFVGSVLASSSTPLRLFRSTKTFQAGERKHVFLLPFLVLFWCLLEDFRFGFSSKFSCPTRPLSFTHNWMLIRRIGIDVEEDHLSNDRIRSSCKFNDCSLSRKGSKSSTMFTYARHTRFFLRFLLTTTKV